MENIMVKGFIFGQLELNIMENSKMEKSLELESDMILIQEYIMENGIKEKIRVKELIFG